MVTDDRGRYLLPDLPKANYSVWVRGYGLVDSPKVQTAPGKILDLTAVVAPNAAAAAEYYPAIYWYSMLKIPDKSEFPGTGPNGNGIPAKLKTQAQWLDVVKTNGCFTCHQLGNKATRTIPKELGDFETSVAAWERRIQSGQAMTQMIKPSAGRPAARVQIVRGLDRSHRRRRTARLAAVAAARRRAQRRHHPVGLGRPKAYLHDEISTDKRNPTVNANGSLYGAPRRARISCRCSIRCSHTASQMKMPVRDPETPSSKHNPMTPSPYWGEEAIWDSQTNMHNPMFDEKGRVWFTSRVRPPANPAFCKKGSDHPSAKLSPIESANRHLSMYDPTTGKFTLISTCFPTHHLVFAEDANNTLWTSAGGPAAGSSAG